MREACLFCDKIATKKIGCKFICESCASDLYSIFEEDIKEEIEHNIQLIDVIREISKEIVRIKRDISEIKRGMR